MRVSVDREICASSSRCAFDVPEVFDQDDEGLVVTLLTTLPPEFEARVRKAAHNCPSGAITVVED